MCVCVCVCYIKLCRRIGVNGRELESHLVSEYVVASENVLNIIAKCYTKKARSTSKWKVPSIAVIHMHNRPTMKKERIVYLDTAASNSNDDEVRQRDRLLHKAEEIRKSLNTPRLPLTQLERLDSPRLRYTVLVESPGIAVRCK